MTKETDLGTGWEGEVPTDGGVSEVTFLGDLWSSKDKCLVSEVSLRDRAP